MSSREQPVEKRSLTLLSIEINHTAIVFGATEMELEVVALRPLRTPPGVRISTGSVFLPKIRV